MSRILFKYPSRNRSELFKETFAKWRDQVSGKHIYTWLFTFDEEDSQINSYINVINEISVPTNGCHDIKHNIHKGRGKVSACNYGIETMKQFAWDIVILVADDLFPIVRNYDDAVVQEMTKAAPNNQPMALHFPDGHCSTEFFQPILNRPLFDKLGYIYNPCYKSIYCDNELTDICRELKAYTYLKDRLIIVHPWIEYTGKDELTIYNEAHKFLKHDRRLYKKRRKLSLKHRIKAG